MRGKIAPIRKKLHSSHLKCRLFIILPIDIIIHAHKNMNFVSEWHQACSQLSIYVEMLLEKAL